MFHQPTNMLNASIPTFMADSIHALPNSRRACLTHGRRHLFDKLVARAVTRDSVVIQGPDTTWVLGFRRPE